MWLNSKQYFLADEREDSKGVVVGWTIGRAVGELYIGLLQLGFLLHWIFYSTINCVNFYSFSICLQENLLNPGLKNQNITKTFIECVLPRDYIIFKCVPKCDQQILSRVLKTSNYLIVVTWLIRIESINKWQAHSVVRFR